MVPCVTQSILNRDFTGPLRAFSSGSAPCNRANFNFVVKVLDFVKSGGADGIRTRDFLLAKQALSH